MSAEDQVTGSGPSPSTPVVSPAAGRQRRPLVVTVIAAVVVIVIVVAGVVIFDKASAAISAGNGTATIEWVPAAGGGGTPGGPPQSFTGTIGGNSLSGVATTVLPTDGASPSAAPTGTVPIFHYRGSFAGKPFTIEVSFTAPSAPTSPGAESLVVHGTYDGQAVHAVIGPPRDPTRASSPVPFAGAIGRWRVVGAIHCCAGTPRKQTATASYSVRAP